MGGLSLALGIISIVAVLPVFFLLPYGPFFLAVVGIAGIVLAAIKMKKGGKGTCVGGLVCSIIGLVFNLPFFVIYLLAILG